MTKKVVLITGVSSGFGRAIAEELLRAGMVVYGTVRREVAGLPEGLQLVELDVTKPETIEPAVAKIIEQEGRVDVLINNAGLGIAGAVELATREEVDLQINTNLYGVINMSSAVLPTMRKQRSGLIINMSSIGGIFAVPYQGFYSVSKFAIEAYSEALSLETKQFGIFTVILEPGDFNTGFTQNRKCSILTQQSDDYKDSFQRVLENIEKDETNGGKPEYLARRVRKIVESRSPKLRYVITPSFVQRLSVFAYKILPDRLFQSILRLFYSV